MNNAFLIDSNAPLKKNVFSILLEVLLPIKHSINSDIPKLVVS